MELYNIHMLLGHVKHEKLISYFPFILFSRTTAGWRYLFLSMLAVTAAMLCKEQGITICGICAVYEIFIVQKVRKMFFFAFIMIEKSTWLAKQVEKQLGEDMWMRKLKNSWKHECMIKKINWKLLCAVFIIKRMFWYEWNKIQFCMEKLLTFFQNVH